MGKIMVIVDDMKMNREILKNLFCETYDILEAASGEEALACIESCEQPIEIVLLDLMLPGISGFDVLEQRKMMESFYDVPVVVITGSEQLEDQVKAFDLGASDFVSKPFVPEVVISRVNNVISSYQRVLDMQQETQKMKMKSELDAMTGLYNKTTTENLIEKEMLSAEGKLNVILIIDVDNFKTVNDTIGHQAGDKVIKKIAKLIASEFRKTDIVGRIGGDEFCAMMIDVPNMDIVYNKVNEMLLMMKYKPNISIPEYVNLSIGIAQNDRKQSTHAEMIKKADQALYDAKHNGKAQYREYGVEPLKVEHDKRPIAVLISDNRSICSVFPALIPVSVRIVEVDDLAQLEQLSEVEKERIRLIYVDVSGKSGDASEVWQSMKELEWMPMNRMMAICREGDVAQYLSALHSGVADMFTAPLEHDGFKRRAVAQLEKIGIGK